MGSISQVRKKGRNHEGRKSLWRQSGCCAEQGEWLRHPPPLQKRSDSAPQPLAPGCPMPWSLTACQIIYLPFSLCVFSPFLFSLSSFPFKSSTWVLPLCPHNQPRGKGPFTMGFSALTAHYKVLRQHGSIASVPPHITA